MLAVSLLNLYRNGARTEGMNENKPAVEEVRRALGEKVDARGYRDFTPEARKLAAEYALARIAAGASTLEAARELGMKGWTLQRWVQNHRRAASRVARGFRPVKVTSEAVTGLVVRGAHGVEVEGLSLETAARLLRELACLG